LTEFSKSSILFSVIAIEQFKMPPEQSGMMLSYTGVISLIMQGFGVGILSSKMTDVSLMKLSTVLLTFAYLALVNYFNSNSNSFSPFFENWNIFCIFGSSCQRIF